MDIKISDDILKMSNTTADELRLEFAILLYKNKGLSMGQASEIANIHQIQFQKELAKRKITINYDLDSFREDILTLRDEKKS